MGQRDDRIAENKSLFRRVNEAIAGAAIEHDRAYGEMPLVCECPALHCARILHLTLEQYGAVREHQNRFIVAPGHEIEGVEEPVEKHAGYLVVEKSTD